MKVRSSFVSNSSSASFVVLWQDLKEREMSIKRLLAHLFDLDYMYDEEKDDWKIPIKGEEIELKSFIPESEEPKKMFKPEDPMDLQYSIDRICEVTKNLSDSNTYESVFFTSMANDLCRDFGIYASDLVMALLTNDKKCFRIIKTYVESDNLF
jgi:hypothetical protein